MKVFKFGGASVQSIDRIKNLAQLMRAEKEHILVVVSAMGKTTNALEEVAAAFYKGRNEEALKLFEVIKQQHLSTLKALVTLTLKQASEELANFFTEVEWLLHDTAVREYGYYYDQIVCIGELLSTSILSSFLNEEKIMNKWMDVRDIIRTDDAFQDAIIDWDFTQHKVAELVLPAFEKYGLIITRDLLGLQMKMKVPPWAVRGAIILPRYLPICLMRNL